MDKGKRNKRGARPPKEKPEFDQYILDLARVTRVTKGGKQLSFRACVIIGDRRGRVGYGVQKGKDVQMAVEKAVNNARKNMIRVPIIKDTIPHRVEAKFKAAKLMIKPAPRGSGLIAGSMIRNVLDLAGVPNASAKMLGKSNNKIANVKAAFSALQSFKPSALAPAPAPVKASVENSGGAAAPAAAPDSAKPKKTRAPRAVKKDDGVTHDKTSAAA
ncbi:MAG: hypothetical protein UY92_C0009G0040 [Candidatus Magasanikbacteria bacterium GW2011_GWA2_56_11]|uniref:Small ribosomal subunit protein uS5 n=1 Tax=Candidatus Magasanikbacteria bacterium GW2011_GWA2_56_11 TaxID=1619044 RepID=A0A0G1YG88_9BACT|nr:MAG: hypothetical protein UY92_C0009G0040 [Candidatus Magasanikbacteria bacterium GW2011_GWA2_56_11]